MTVEIKTPQSQRDYLRSLDGVELALEFMKFSGIPFVSPCPGFFAVAHPKRNEILIFGGEKGVVRPGNLADDFLLDPFHLSIMSNLNFTMKNGMVECDADDGLGTVRGKNYLEATIKWVLIYLTEIRVRKNLNRSTDSV